MFKGEEKGCSREKGEGWTNQEEVVSSGPRGEFLDNRNERRLPLSKEAGGLLASEPRSSLPRGFPGTSVI